MLPPESVLEDAVKPLTCDDCPVASFDGDPDCEIVWCDLCIPLDGELEGAGKYQIAHPVAVVEGVEMPCARAVTDREHLRMFARRILKTLECAGEEDGDAADH